MYYERGTLCALSIRMTNRFVDANTLIVVLEAKKNLVKMICSPASGVASLLGGFSHPEMFCVSVGSNNNFRYTRFRNKISVFCCLFCAIALVTQSLKSKSKPR